MVAGNTFQCSMDASLWNHFTRSVKVNLFIAYELDTWSRDLNRDLTVGNCLLGAMNLTKNSEPDKYWCSVSNIVFDFRSHFFNKVLMEKNPINQQMY